MKSRRVLAVVAVAAVVGACGLGLYVRDGHRTLGDLLRARPPLLDGEGERTPAAGTAGTAGAAGAAGTAGTAGADGAQDALPGASVVLEGTKILVPGPSGEAEWSFEAERIEMSTAQGVVRLTEVEGARYAAGKLGARVKAGTLVADLGTGRIEFQDGVEVSASEARSFRAHGAVWDPGTASFVASGDVAYQDGAASLSGDSLTADAGLGTARVEGRARFSTAVSGSSSKQP